MKLISGEFKVIHYILINLTPPKSEFIGFWRSFFISSIDYLALNTNFSLDVEL